MFLYSVNVLFIANVFNISVMLMVIFWVVVTCGVVEDYIVSEVLTANIIRAP